MADHLTEHVQVNINGTPSVYFEGKQRVPGDAHSSSTRSFTPLKVLSDGPYSTVWLCDWHAHWTLPPNTPLSLMQSGAYARPEWAGKHLVAVKRMKKTWECGWTECRYSKELRSLREIAPHPNIVPLYDFFLEQHFKKLYFVFECMAGNLQQLIKSRKGRPLAGGLICLIFRQITFGLGHIHASGFFHRDLKPENVLVTTTGSFEYTPFSATTMTQTHVQEDLVVVVKLIDFGLAKETQSLSPYAEYGATTWYQAPEVLLLSRDYSAPVDMWALGTILAELVNLRPFFRGSGQIDQMVRICEILGDPSDVYGSSSQNEPAGGGKWPEGMELAKRIGFIFPKIPPTDLHSLFDSTVPRSLIQCIGDLLKYDPQARLTSHQCAQHTYFLEESLKIRELPGLTSSAPFLLARHHDSPSHLNPANDLTTKDSNATQALIREAITILCHVMSTGRTVSSGKEGILRDEVEERVSALVLLKREWEAEGTIDQGASEIKEKQVFAEALRDGKVLCQFLNKLFPLSFILPEAPKDEFSLDSAVNKFLVACSSLGLRPEDIFLLDDLIDATVESLARVAGTVIVIYSQLNPDKSPLLSLEYPSNMGTGNRKIEVWGSEDMPTVHMNRVYQNLHLFLMESFSANEQSSEQRFWETLCDLVQSMASPDPISCLVKSRRYRVKLLQISSGLGVSNDPRLREALRKDEVEIANLLKATLNSETNKKVMGGLHGDDAQEILDLIQDVLDKGSVKNVEDEEFNSKAHRLLVKLSQTCDILPSSLFIKGVMRLDKEPTFGGTYGDIYRASYRGVDVALKRMRVFQRDSGRHKIRRRFCQEALLWRHLKHPFVLPFIGIDAESFPLFLCMVSPWMRHGNISKHLADHGNANVDTLLLEIAQGLAYLHSQKIVHGDLRGSNILVDEEWHACLADFGLSVFADASVATRTSHQGGSIRWMAPELHFPQEFGLNSYQRTFASDTYSFACVCIELYTGRPPFWDHPYDSSAMLTVLNGGRPQRPSEALGRIVSDEMWDLVESCWSQNFIDRPRMDKVVEIMRKMDYSATKLTCDSLSTSQIDGPSPVTVDNVLDSPSGGGSLAMVSTVGDSGEMPTGESAGNFYSPGSHSIQLSDGPPESLATSQMPVRAVIASPPSSAPAPWPPERWRLAQIHPQISRSFTMSSFKDLEEIKTDIVRVLDVKNVTYHASGDVFYCFFLLKGLSSSTPLLDRQNVSSVTQSPNNALSSGPADFFTQLTPPQSPTLGSEGTVTEGAADGVHDAGNMDVTAPNTDWSVRFEIHVDVGRFHERLLHKIQFSKTDGDERHYEQLVTQIKAELAW